MSAIIPTKPHVPKDTISLAFDAAGTSAIVGTVVSAVQNSLAKHNYGAFGVVTRSGSTIALFASIGAFYSLGNAAASNLRERDDAWNSVWGGVLAGACMGIYKRTLPAVVGYSVGTGLLMGTFAWGGGSIGGIYSHMSPQEREAWDRKFFSTEQRRPRSEVLSELSAAPRQHRAAD